MLCLRDQWKLFAVPDLVRADPAGLFTVDLFVANIVEFDSFQVGSILAQAQAMGDGLFRFASGGLVLAQYLVGIDVVLRL